MSALENARHEKFAQERAKGLSIDAAYEAAGYAPNRGNASRLSANEGVMKRVLELQEKSAEQAGITLEWLLEQGKALLLAAKDAEDFSAASSTYERLAKISGNWVDRSDNRNTNTTRLISDAPMGEDEWLTTHSPRPN